MRDSHLEPEGDLLRPAADIQQSHAICYSDNILRKKKMKIFNKFNQQYKYYFLTKPYSIQPYPSSHEPIDIVYFDMPKTIKGYSTMVYGYVIFDNKLDDLDCSKYGLLDSS